MKPNIAKRINLLLVLGSGVQGYVSLNPEHLRNVNVDIFACLAVFVGFILFSYGSIEYAIRKRPGMMIRSASWTRFSLLSWWSDPLQNLYLCMIFTGSMAFGALFHVFSTLDVGRWVFGTYVGITLGLLAGTWIAKRKFRDSIE